MADAKPKKDKKAKRKADAEDGAAPAEDIGAPAVADESKPKRRKTDATADATEAAGVADQDAVDERAKRKAAKAAAALAAAGGDEAKAAADKEARKAAKRAAKAAVAASPTRKSPRLAAAAAAAAHPPALALNGKATKPAAAAAAAAAAENGAAAGAGAGADAKDPNKPDEKGNPPITQFVKNPEIVAALAARNMTHLFAIQAATFPLVVAGKDVLGRARTGTGKTLAFALPIIDRLQAADAATYGGKNYKLPARRLPRVIVLLPTRELALQVAKEFELVGKRLATTCVYGGSSYQPQESAIRAGVDVVVGTCGRVMDMLDRNTPYLKLDKVEHIVLDEADEMLNMGFQEAVESILQRVPRDKQPVQTLLFSATVPEWVHNLSKKYFRPDFQKIDLVGNSQMQASADVHHIAIPCHWSERKSVLADVVLVHGGGAGRTIIFTETKKEANELATDSSIASDCQALHGDIAQNQREITLKGFRDRRFKILVATDVAARGLDIAGVELVIQAEPPRDHETYIHRSGRTGRAGQKGTCVIFYTPKQLYELQQIERRAKVKFTYATVPTAKQIVVARAKTALAAIDSVQDAVLPYFTDSAKELIERKGGDAQKALAYALAVIAGQTSAVSERSLLCSAQGWTTVSMTSKKAGEEIRTLSFVWTLIRKYLYPNDEATDTKVKGMRFLKAKNGAVFDIPSEDAAKLFPGDQKIDNFGCVFECVRDKLPELQPQATSGPSGGFGGGFGGRGRGGGFGGGRGRGGFRGARR